MAHLCTHPKCQAWFGHHNFVKTKAFQMLVVKSVKPKNHFLGCMMERSKALPSGEETANYRLGMFNTEYVDERTDIDVPQKTDIQQAREIGKLPVHEYSTLHSGYVLSVCMCVLCVGVGGSDLPRDEALVL